MTRISSLLPLFLIATSASSAERLPEFHASPWFEEQVREEWVMDGVRVLMNAAVNFDAKKPTRLLIFATPNGNTIEQTLGCQTTKDMDWHFDIQHVMAQVRQFRLLAPKENVVLVCVEALGLKTVSDVTGPQPVRASELNIFVGSFSFVRGWLIG